MNSNDNKLITKIFKLPIGGVTISTTFVFKAIRLTRCPISFRSVVAVATLDSPTVRLTPCPPTVVDRWHVEVRQTAVILQTT